MRFSVNLQTVKGHGKITPPPPPPHPLGYIFSFSLSYPCIFYFIILQVLLFTVDDRDKHLVRRVHPTRSPVDGSTTAVSDLRGKNHNSDGESAVSEPQVKLSM